MKVKVSDLIGPALNWAVAVCEGWQPTVGRNYYGFAVLTSKYGGDYSIDWQYGGPIIDEHDIDVLRDGDTFGARLARAQKHPQREVLSYFVQRGPTKLIAAMRCYVASKLGDEVEIPDELAKDPTLESTTQQSS